jgi:nickel superoxide dismutase
MGSLDRLLQANPFNDATKLAGAAGTKGTNDVAVADNLLAKIDEISEIFWATKK